MDSYIDIRVQPDPEFPASMLMSALMGKLHRALVNTRQQQIGISLPEHRENKSRTPGNVLRLHGSHQDLSQLMEQDWLRGMRDHIEASDIKNVPENTTHRVVRRRQFKTNAERMRRRRMQRHGETMEQAREKIPDSIERRVELPYFTLRSQSTQQTYCLFIEHGPLQEMPVVGEFNSHGLSEAATIPWF